MQEFALTGFCLISAVSAAGWFLLRRAAAGRRSAERLFESHLETVEPLGGDGALTAALRRWLLLAGYRNRAAPATFVAATVAAACFGLLTIYLCSRLGVMDAVRRNLELLPPAVGDLFLPVAQVAPWLLFLMFAAMPWLAVRRTRRERVERVEQDLPIALELLSTLSEAGLGFDAALSHILESAVEDRPLAREFRTYQADLLAGRSRVEALRRLASRLEVSSMTILVSALAQAEQLGAGIAEALHRQAADLRDRRRERANAFAMALPVKRMFPLVVCFMPGIFIWTLGPFFVQLFQIADNLMRVRRM